MATAHFGVGNQFGLFLGRRRLRLQQWALKEMWFLLGPCGAGAGGNAGKTPFRRGKDTNPPAQSGTLLLCAFARPLRGNSSRSRLPARISRAPTAPAGPRHSAWDAQAAGRRDRGLSKSAARRRKKHGAGKQYVQNPQGIAVNSFLFEENLQLGNRPFYDLFGLVIGCGWSCAGSERFHGLFLISLANFPLHSAFRGTQPLFS